jgi:hypothetical protein
MYNLKIYNNSTFIHVDITIITKSYDVLPASLEREGDIRSLAFW